MSPASNALSSPGGAAFQGALRFGAVSLAVFATVAFGERWMYQNLGLAGAYALWTLLFVGLGAFALGGLVEPGKRTRLYLCFALGFLAYAIGWIASYFLLHGTAGEWVGSVVGSILMALVFAIGFGRASRVPQIAAILFAANSLGYFAGSALNDAITGQAGMMLWGALYGLGLGAGLGLTLRLLK